MTDYRADQTAPGHQLHRVDCMGHGARGREGERESTRARARESFSMRGSTWGAAARVHASRGDSHALVQLPRKNGSMPPNLLQEKVRPNLLPPIISGVFGMR
jgi:hypothetical protein